MTCKMIVKGPLSFIPFQYCEAASTHSLSCCLLQRYLATMVLGFVFTLGACGVPYSDSVISTNGLPATNVTYFDGVTFPHTNAGLAAVISAAGVDGTIDIPSDAIISVTSPHSFLKGQHVVCHSGATFNLNVTAGFPFQLSHTSNFTITGCTFNWQTGTISAIALQNTVSHVRIDKNQFEGFPSGGANTIIFIGDRTNITSAMQVSDVVVTDNIFKNFSSNGVNIQNSVSNVTVSGNYFFTDTTTDNNIAINAQTSDAGTVITNITISGNHISNGMGGDCVQVQRINGDIIHAVVVSGNSCVFMGPSNGYSMAGIDGLAETGNVLVANSYGLSVGNAAFELANVTNGYETGNKATLGLQSSNIDYIIFSVIAPRGLTANNTVEGNSASIRFSGNQTAQCIFIGATDPNGVVKQNIISNNTCDFAGSVGKTAGIFVQAASTTARISQNIIRRNLAIGNNVEGDCGICIENDAGTMSANAIGLNHIVHFHLDYGSNFGGQVAAPPWPHGVKVMTEGPMSSLINDAGSLDPSGARDPGEISESAP